MSKSYKGRSIELFYVNGDPEGMVTAAIPFQWTGHVLVANRTQLKEALERPETARPGIYMLSGEAEEESMLYIGESEDIRTRLKQHAAGKDWWSMAICITSSGDPLNKAHIRYLESRLIADAQKLKRVKLDNGTSPMPTGLSEAARAHMETFLENLYLVLPALRFDFFIEQAEKATEAKASATSDDTVRFCMEIPKHDLKASARLEKGKFIVEKGSRARNRWIGKTTAGSGYARLYDELVAQGVLAESGRHRVYTQDYAFKSPSAAAAVTAGRSTSGPATWVLEGTNKTYGEWERELLGPVEEDT